MGFSSLSLHVQEGAAELTPTAHVDRNSSASAAPLVDTGEGGHCEGEGDTSTSGLRVDAVATAQGWGCVIGWIWSSSMAQTTHCREQG